MGNVRSLKTTSSKHHTLATLSSNKPRAKGKRRCKTAIKQREPLFTNQDKMSMLSLTSNRCVRCFNLRLHTAQLDLFFTF